MLSYKHGYHAGNNADVFKHICLLQAYKTLKKHHNSISYIDTHAGSGIYKFDSDYMSKNKEYLGGISKLEDYKYDNISIKYFLKVLLSPFAVLEKAVFLIEIEQFDWLHFDLQLFLYSESLFADAFACFVSLLLVEFEKFSEFLYQFCEIYKDYLPTTC